MNANDLAPLISRIRLDLRSGIPIYMQIMEQIKQLVASGTLKAGDQLPTVRALAQELRVNFNTVARSYRLLDEAGVISTQQGRGTYILEIPPPEKAEKLRRQALEALARRYLREALQLGYTPDDIIRALQEQVTDWHKTNDLSDHE
ncbi:MAG: GntR family transcriptional regulator [Chloroflexi bacterium]|nr:GntR family transcriptional regulator [Chloroflexota bacterium]